MKRKNAEERYKDNLRKQQKTLEKFAAHEIDWAGDLIRWYSLRKEDMPADEYRACAFFINKEFTKKPGSLTLLYGMFQRCMEELPEVTRELAFDILAYRFKLYARVLQTGGYDGTTNWG